MAGNQDLLLHTHSFMQNCAGTVLPGLIGVNLPGMIGVNRGHSLKHDRRKREPMRPPSHPSLSALEFSGPCSTTIPSNTERTVPASSTASPSEISASRGCGWSDRP